LKITARLSGENALIADWLSHYLFDSIGQVQDFASRWRLACNNERPNMALGGITPRQKLAMVA
jgi:putative transposase